MRRLPKVGERVRVKPINRKGRVMAVHVNLLTSSYSDIWPAIQVSLDKPYRSAPTWRAHKEELVFIKESAKAKRMAELQAKILEMRRKKKMPKKPTDKKKQQELKDRVKKREEQIKKSQEKRRRIKK